MPFYIDQKMVDTRKGANNMLYGIVRIGDTEAGVRVHLLDDKEDCIKFIKPWQWNFFRSCFEHLGIDSATVMVVSKEQYDRVMEAQKGKK